MVTFFYIVGGIWIISFLGFLGFAAFAPKGYEDRDGFHYENPPLKQTNTKPLLLSIVQKWAP